MNQLQVNHLTRFSGSKKTQYARHCQDLIQCFPHRPLASTNCCVVLMVSQETLEKRIKQLSVLYDIWSFTMTVRAENLEARAFYKQHWTSILWSPCPRKCAQKDTGPLCPSPSQPPTLATKNVELSISHHLVVLQTGNHDLWQNDDPSSSYASTAVNQQWRVGALGFTCTVCMTSNRLDLFKVCYEKNQWNTKVLRDNGIYTKPTTISLFSPLRRLQIRSTGHQGTRANYGDCRQISASAQTRWRRYELAAHSTYGKPSLKNAFLGWQNGRVGKGTHRDW